MSINFGGLATGIDTESIVSELMKIERSPIDRLEKDRTFYKSRLDAFSKLDEKLKSLLEKAQAIDSALELNSPAVRSNSEEFFTATAGGSAQLGTYQVTVVALAQQQKDVSQGYVDKTAASFGTGNLNLTVGGTPNSITIDSSNNSLEGIAKAINDANLGVSAAIINDGTATPYRLVLTGDSVANSFSLDSAGLSGGSETSPAMTNTQVAQQAHAILDGIDIYSDSNSVDSSIPGLSIELLKADSAVATTLNVTSDKDATKGKIKEFVDAYNGIISFIAEQKTADWGNDPVFRSVKRRLQSFLVTQQGSGTFSSLARLGFETQRDGKILLNNSTLTSALSDDYQGVIKLFAGDGLYDGIGTTFANYLKDITDFSDGFYVSKKQGTDSTLRRIDLRITSLESRMEQKEKSLRAQFTAMENLVSGLNAQGGYLLQQLANMPSIGGGNG